MRPAGASTPRRDLGRRVPRRVGRACALRWSYASFGRSRRAAPSRPAASSSASGRRRTSAGHRRSGPEGRPSPQSLRRTHPDPASRQALCRPWEQRRRRARNRLLYGTTFVVALALIVVGLRVWGSPVSLCHWAPPRQSSTPAKATAVSARASATRAACRRHRPPPPPHRRRRLALPSRRLAGAEASRTRRRRQRRLDIAPCRLPARGRHRLPLRAAGRGGTHVDAATAWPHRGAHPQ